ncbi:MAG: GTP-binding protein, partial [bacterium]
AGDQIIFTDFVVINKSDIVEKDRLAEIKQFVEMTNPRARVFEAVKANIDIRLLTDPDRVWDQTTETTHKHDEYDNHEDHNHAHDSYQHLSIELDQPLHPMKFQDFVNTKIPKSIYRAKGFIDMDTKGHSRKFIFQLVGTRSELYWDNWKKDEDHLTRLVFIGTDFNSEQLEADLRGCIDETPETELEGIDLKLPTKWEG